MYKILVRADYPWDVAQVAGRRFHKRVVTALHANELTDEIKNSPLLDITPGDPETEPAPVIETAPATETKPIVEPEPAKTIKHKRGTK